MFKKNVTGQSTVFVLLTAAGVPVTGAAGSITIGVSLDGALPPDASAGTITEVNSGTYPGYYKYAFTQAETNAQVTTLYIQESTAFPQKVEIPWSDATFVWNSNGVQFDGVANASATLSLAGFDVGAVTFDSVVIDNPAGVGLKVNGSTYSVLINHSGTNHAVQIANGPMVSAGTHALYLSGGVNATAATIRVDSAQNRAIRYVSSGSFATYTVENDGTGDSFEITAVDGDGLYISGGGVGNYDINADNWNGVNVPSIINTNLDATVSSRATQVSVDALPTLAQMLAGGVSLEATSQQILAAVQSQVGPGADPVTVKILVGVTPLANANVWISSDAGGSNVVAGTLATDITGELEFLLTYSVTYYIWVQKVGYNSIYGESFVAAAPTAEFTTTAAAATTTGFLTLTEARRIVLESVLHVANGGYTTAQIDDAIKLAGQYFMRKTQCVQKTGTVPILNGVRTLDIPATLPDFNYWMYSRTQIPTETVYLHLVQRGDYAKIARAYCNTAPTGRPRVIGFQTNNDALLIPTPDDDYEMTVVYAEPLVTWVSGTESPDDVTINIPPAFVNDVLWFGAGTALVYGEQYQNFYAQKGWPYFLAMVDQVVGMININSDDTYEGDYGPDAWNFYNGGY